MYTQNQTSILALIFLGMGNFHLHTADVTLTENLPAGSRVAVEVSTQISGTMTLPAVKEKQPQTLTVTGQSRLEYDERVLPHDEKDTDKLLRIYRTIDIQRTVGDKPQTATIRPAVKRMVVLRSAKGKSPFSPDGPLIWAEIDVVKNDLFCQVLVKDMLPGKAVKEGDAWDIGPDAVRELTDIAKVSAGKLTMKFLGVVTFDGKDRARLAISGSVKGVDDNGPCRHSLDGTAYFDLGSAMLVYLSVKGTHELLDGEGRTAGRVDGRMTLTRRLSDTDALSDDAVKKLELNPTAENTRLLYVNDNLGVSFAHPRRWKVGAIQGTQISLDGPNASGILITMETKKTLPTAEAYLKESQEFITKAKGTFANVDKVNRVQTEPLKLDRFGFDADLAEARLRMEYAVLTDKETGVTLAAKLPRRDATELTADVDVLAKSLRLIAVKK